MGIAKTNGQLRLLQDVIRQERIVLSGLRMAELGNQYFRDDVLGTEVSAKLVFEAMGVCHSSIDINGADGAEPFDLSEELPERWGNQFDVVTNFGTSEHVERSQYICWRNIHHICRLGGYMIHSLPEIGSWPRHGKWHYDLTRMIALATAWDVDNYEQLWRLCVAERHESVHDDGRLQHSLLFAFQKKSPAFVSEAFFQDIMFPPGEPHY